MNGLRRWWRRRTLRTRITVVVGVVALVALLAVARLAAGLLFAAVVSAGDTGLRERAAVVAERVRAGVPTLADGAVRVVDAAGRPVDGDGPVPLPPDAVMRLAAGEAVTVASPGPGADGTGPRRWVAVAVPAPDGAPRFVLASRDLLGALALLVGSAPWFLVAAVLGAGLVALAAWGATRAALGPVDRMRAAATGLDPGQRLPVPPADDELRALAVALNDVLARRDDAVTRLERFTGDAAHELRSPLAALRAQADVAVAHPDVEADADTWRSVADEAARLTDLLADLLALARADAGDRAAARPVDLVAAARAAVGRDERDPGHRTPPGPPVATSLWAPLPAVVAAGETEVALVVANLVANARRHARSLVRVSVVPSGAWVRLLVDDDGPGIAPEDRDRVLDRFTRLDPTAGPGSGLGLALVTRLVEGRGGSVRIATASTGGARLAVRWPAAGLSTAAGR